MQSSDVRELGTGYEWNVWLEMADGQKHLLERGLWWVIPGKRPPPLFSGQGGVDTVLYLL